MDILPVGVRKPNLSFVTGVFNGAPNSFQFGKSSFSATGSTHAPDKICPPKKNYIIIHYIIITQIGNKL